MMTMMKATLLIAGLSFASATVDPCHPSLFAACAASEPEQGEGQCKGLDMYVSCVNAFTSTCNDPAITGPARASMGNICGECPGTEECVALGLQKPVPTPLVSAPAPPAVNKGECALNGARAVDDMLDSAVYIMASIARCGDKDTIRCEVDVASAIESVNAMVNVILKAVQQCGGFETKHEKCGMAIGVLTRSMAGLAAASGGIAAKCPNKMNGFHPLDTVGQDMENAQRYGGQTPYKTAFGENAPAAPVASPAAAPVAPAAPGSPCGTVAPPARRLAFNTKGFSPNMGQCVINIKDTIKSLFKAIARIMRVKERCTGENAGSIECQHNSIKIVAAFTGLAEYIAGSIGKCSADSKFKADALCTQMSIRLFHQLGEVDRAGTAMAMDCELTKAQRLYLDNESTAAPVAAAPASSGNSMTIALTALLPLTAVVGFVGGKRMRARPQAMAADCEAFVAEE